MNIKLAFSPVSQNPVDLLAVVLDDEKTLHEIDDPAIAAHVAAGRGRLPRQDAEARVLRDPARGRQSRGRSSSTGARSSRAGTSGRT